jgi:putative acetyltransferase
MIKIREEIEEDYTAVRKVNDDAFGKPEEGSIVDKIREACDEIISLVAVEGEKVVGHIFFSPAVINHNGKEIKGIGLAPMAVHPEYQNKGIGSLLVEEGIKRLKETSCPFIIVLGHEKYYPRFGFETASKYGIKPQWEGVPDEAFMIMINDKEKMAGVSGVAKYRKEFDEAM